MIYINSLYVVGDDSRVRCMKVTNCNQQPRYTVIRVGSMISERRGFGQFLSTNTPSICAYKCMWWLFVLLKVIGGPPKG